MITGEVYDDVWVLGSRAELLGVKNEVGRLLDLRLREAGEPRKLLGPERKGVKKDDKMVCEARFLRAGKGAR